MEREQVSSGAPWEPLVGYSRAVRVGPWVSVSGTTAALPGGGVVGEGDAGEQTHEAIRRIAAALGELGGGLEHVVRTRMYVTDIGRWEEVGRAHGRAFAAVRPASTMVQVAALIDPALLVEVEAEPSSRISARRRRTRTTGRNTRTHGTVESRTDFN